MRRRRPDCLATADRPPFAVRSIDVRSLGRGVAIGLDAGPLHDLHAQLRARWLPWFSAQDRARYCPHVTVQNKVDPATAKATLQTLARRSGRNHTGPAIDVAVKAMNTAWAALPGVAGRA